MRAMNPTSLFSLRLCVKFFFLKCIYSPHGLRVALPASLLSLPAKGLLLLSALARRRLVCHAQ
jgi:hypothetical protein